MDFHALAASCGTYWSDCSHVFHIRANREERCADLGEQRGAKQGIRGHSHGENCENAGQ